MPGLGLKVNGLAQHSFRSYQWIVRRIVDKWFWVCGFVFY